METFDPDNLLARGQTIEGVDETEIVDLEMCAGEMSIHHNKSVHSSMPNPSDHPRIGFAIHIAPPHVRQTQFDGVTATVVRGQDKKPTIGSLISQRRRIWILSVLWRWTKPGPTIANT